jgi:glutamate--cysteine ligase
MAISLAAELLKGRKIGLERETVRVDMKTQQLAMTANPEALGSALTHPSITTDYAEAMLEFVTSTHDTTQGAYNALLQVTAWTQKQLAASHEALWPYSMPPKLPRGDEIAPANYGNSGVGQFKHIYRLGLGHRYGREMQLISGVHFNYSLSEAAITQIATEHGYAFSSAKEARNMVYLGAIRNIQRYGWLVSYLLGASPRVDPAFVCAVQRANELPESAMEKYQQATSLRMSDIGYTNKRRCRWQAQLNDFDGFIDSIAVGLAETCGIFQNMPIKNADGEWQQLNDKVLQIENEYYSIARPKSVAEDGDPPIVSLCKQGVQYLELRLTDIDPFQANGMSAKSLVLLELFLLHCMVMPSPAIYPEQQARYDENRLRVAEAGQMNAMLRMDDDSEVSAKDAALAILTQFQDLAETLDAANKVSLAEGQAVGPAAVMVVEEYQNEVKANSLLSHRVAAAIDDIDSPERVDRFGFDLARQHQMSLVESNIISEQTDALMEKQRLVSLQQAQEIEQSSESFTEYREKYYGKLEKMFEHRKIPILN